MVAGGHRGGGLSSTVLRPADGVQPETVARIVPMKSRGARLPIAHHVTRFWVPALFSVVVAVKPRAFSLAVPRCLVEPGV